MLQLLEELQQEEKRHPSDIKDEPSYRLTPTSSFAGDLDTHDQDANGDGPPATDNDKPLEEMEMTADNPLTAGDSTPKTPPRSKVL